jgi:hypothetical protein
MVCMSFQVHDLFHFISFQILNNYHPKVMHISITCMKDILW